MFPILLILWLIFAGSLTVTNLILGALISALLTLFCSKFMGYDTKRFYRGLRKALKVAAYLAVLLKEILLSNLAVLKIIWRKEPPRPVLVRFRSDLKSEGLRVLVANSITLTPGTYSVQLVGQDYAVHALDEAYADGIEDNVFFRMARGLEDA